MAMSGYQELKKSGSVPDASQPISTNQKRCTKCGLIKLLNEFHRERCAKDGRKPSCKECSKEYSQKWREANHEKAKENCRKWRRNNPKKVKEQNQQWYAANIERSRRLARERQAANPEKARKRARERRRESPEKVKREYKKWYNANIEAVKEKCREWRSVNPNKHKENARRWRENNKEKAKEGRKRWQIENPGKNTVYNRNRKARKRNADGVFNKDDIQTIFESQGGQCNTCGKNLIRYNKKQYHIDHITPIAKGGSNWPKNLQLLCPKCNLSKHAKDAIQWARENGRLF